tara:strand:+ start:63 stop:1511 length:1449 start_codon:yes stop_codon:yes gene_type:complete
MVLNSYFLQGSPGEQTLMQDLVNEHIKIHGIEVYYLPRKIFKTDDIIKEIQSSKFDDSFLIEAYINNVDGYAPDSDIMTKFGLRLKNEVNLTISRERFEDFISPFLEGISSGIREGQITGFTFGDLITRPKEGDLIYFPLGERLFEIKRVEHEKPFYQLGKLYTYDLSCELFEYENEFIDTSIAEVDNQLKDEGYITTIDLVGVAQTATATVGVSSGRVTEIFLNNDGSGFTSAPTITFSDAPEGGHNASAVAITTQRANVTSIFRLEMTNAGAGYTQAPTITIAGGGGSGAAATCSISTTFGVQNIVVGTAGTGYASSPTLTVAGPPSGINTAILNPIFSSSIGAGINTVRILNSGIGYTSGPISLEFSGPTSGIGTFYYNETVTGQSSGVTAVVRDFDSGVRVSAAGTVTVIGESKLRVSLNTGKFFEGETIVGGSSTATYIVKTHDLDSHDQPSDSNEEIELEADSLLDFSESNPFGEY